MSDSDRLERTHVMLLALGAAMFGGTIVELILAEHTDGWIQLLPFLCCGIGLAAIGLVWWRTEPRTLQIFRIIMGLIVATSMVGVGEHIWNALQMTRDFHPGIHGVDLWKTALTSSVPILAPAALAAGAAVALIGTYGITVAPAAVPSMQRPTYR